MRHLSIDDGTFSAWWPEVYDVDVPPPVIGDGPVPDGWDQPCWVCKRCGDRVSYLTFHAVKVHGDDVTLLPAKQGGTFDERGRGPMRVIVA